MDAGRITESEVVPISHVTSIAATVSVDAEAVIGVSSASSIATIAKRQSLKGHANQETASAKAKCTLKKKNRKMPELRPKEAMIAYR